MDQITIPQPEYDMDTYNRNYHKLPAGDWPCIICGKHVNPRTAWEVKLTLDEELWNLNYGLSDEISLGMHSITPDCARRIPLAFRQRVNR